MVNSYLALHIWHKVSFAIIFYVKFSILNLKRFKICVFKHIKLMGITNNKMIIKLKIPTGRTKFCDDNHIGIIITKSWMRQYM